MGLTSGITAITLGRWHTCALTDLGGLKCWGTNSNLQLGYGDLVNVYPTPGDVVGFP